MTAYVLVPGAGGSAVVWSDVVDRLRGRGHEAVAVDIREDDPELGLPEYAEQVDAAVGSRTGVVVVAQSMGGFTVPMLSTLERVAGIVLLNAMVPLPGETPGEWFGATGAEGARVAAARAGGWSTDFDVDTYFLHDLPPEVVAGMADGDREPAATPFAQPCAFERWPDIPTRVLVGEDDRFFPAAFQVRVARERLGVEAELLPGGHLVAKSRPDDVVERLLTTVN